MRKHGRKVRTCKWRQQRELVGVEGIVFDDKFYVRELLVEKEVLERKFADAFVVNDRHSIRRLVYGVGNVMLWRNTQWRFIEISVFAFGRSVADNNRVNRNPQNERCFIVKLRVLCIQGQHLLIDCFDAVK